MMGQCKPRPRIRVAEAATAASISPSQGTQTAALTHTLQMLEAFEPSARKGWSDAWFQATDWGDRMGRPIGSRGVEALLRGSQPRAGQWLWSSNRKVLAWPLAGYCCRAWPIELSRNLAAGVADVARSGSTVKG